MDMESFRLRTRQAALHRSSHWPLMARNDRQFMNLATFCMRNLMRPRLSVSCSIHLTFRGPDVSPESASSLLSYGAGRVGNDIPLGLAAVVCLSVRTYAYLATFFAGFCCLSNGLVHRGPGLIFCGVGDAGRPVALWCGSLATVAIRRAIQCFRLRLWNGLGRQSGFGSREGKVDPHAPIGLGVSWSRPCCWNLGFSEFSGGRLCGPSELRLGSGESQSF